MQLILLLVIVSVVCITLQTPSLSTLYEWRVDSIAQGDWLRILSGNFTHTNFTHLAMNLAALWIVAFIFRPTARIYGLLLLIISVAVGFGLFFTDTQAYLGLSGSLHGMFIFFALTEALNGRKSSWVLVAGAIIKVTWEQYAGSPLSSEAAINAPVAINAHLIGLLIGGILAFLYHLRTKNVH